MRHADVHDPSITVALIARAGTRSAFGRDLLHVPLRTQCCHSLNNEFGCPHGCSIRPRNVAQASPITYSDHRLNIERP